MSVQDGSRVLPPWWLLARDIGLFLLGAGIAVWEIATQGAPRDSVLTFAGSLLGGPLALVGLQTLADAIRSRAGTSGPSSPSPGEAPAA